MANKRVERRIQHSNINILFLRFSHSVKYFQ